MATNRSVRARHEPACQTSNRWVDIAFATDGVQRGVSNVLDTYFGRFRPAEAAVLCQPITVNVTAAAGDALRTMLKMANASYVVENQVVTVISLDDLPPENNDQ